MRITLVLITLLFSLQTKAQNLYVLSHDSMEIIKVGEKDLIEVIDYYSDTFSGSFICFDDSVIIANNTIGLNEIIEIQINSKAKRVSSNCCISLSTSSIISAAFTTVLAGFTHPVDMGNLYLVLLGYPIGGVGFLVSKNYKNHYSKYELSENGWQLAIY